MEDKWKINGQRGAYKVIESAQNKLIKEIKSLSDRKNRDEKGLFIAVNQRIPRPKVFSLSNKNWPSLHLYYFRQSLSEIRLAHKYIPNRHYKISAFLE